MLDTRRKVIIGSITFLFMFFLALVVGVSFESNDDAAIAFLISKGANTGAVFQHKWLVCLVNSIFKLMPSINCWTFFSVFIVSGCFAIICVLASEKFKDSLLNAFAVAIIAFFVYDVFITRINFTKTAAMPIIAANALISFEIEKNRFRFFSLNGIAAVALYIVGAAIREEIALLGLAFLAVIIGWHFLYSYRCGEQLESVGQKMKKAGIGIVIALAVFSSIKIDTLTRTDAEKVYQEYNSSRSEVQDYGDNYPSPDQDSVFYENLGYRINDVKVVFNWLDNDQENITPDTFKHLSQLKNKQTLQGLFNAIIDVVKAVVKDFRAFLPLCMIVFVVAILCISDVVNGGIKAFIFFALFAAIVIFFQWKGRLPNRVLETCVFLLAGSLLFSPSSFTLAGFSCNVHKVKRYIIFPIFILFHCFLLYAPINMNWLERVVFFLLGYGFFGFIIFENTLCSLNKVRVMAEGNKKWIGFVGLGIVFALELVLRGNAVSPIYKNESEKTVLEYIDQRKDNIFIVPVQTVGSSVQECKGAWRMAEADYCDNLFYLGGWDSRSPLYLDMQNKKNIGNPMRSLIDDTRVLSVDDNPKVTQIVLTYLHDHFDDSATYTRAEILPDIRFIRYQKTINPQLEEGTYSFDLTAMSFDEEGYMNIGATTDFPDDALYCNIKTRNGIKTYAIISDNGNIKNDFADLEGINQEGIEAMTFFVNEGGSFILLREYSKQELLELL